MDSLSTADLFRVVIANQMIIMGALKRMFLDDDIAAILQHQIDMCDALTRAKQ